MSSATSRALKHRSNVVGKPIILPHSNGSMQDRRSDYDVTNFVKVSSTHRVRLAVQELFQQAFPAAAFDAIWMAFHDFDRLFDGQFEDYLGCDTVYHDKQHSLDMTLAMARLLAGYELSVSEDDKLGADRAVMGLVAALFHDAGYIRRADETRWKNGAEFTAWHVSRSADFLRDYLPRLGLNNRSDLACQVVHFTGYELNLDDIELDNPRDTSVGHLLGTADLMAQMADRCYLEKCRDRLYAEFVICGVAAGKAQIGASSTRYGSGVDLLRQTPNFARSAVNDRLNGKFNKAYRYVEALFDGRNPYLEFVRGNLRYLKFIIEQNEWRALRRRPSLYTVMPDTMQSVNALVSQRIAEEAAPVV